MSEIVKMGGGSFQPSTSKTGNDNLGSILRGKNMLLRGSEGSYYFETYGGQKNLNEPIPMKVLTGTIAYTNGLERVVGTGTLFKTELRFGMKVLVEDQVFVVGNIVSDLAFDSQRPADATASGKTGYKLPVFFNLDDQRGSMIWGSAIKTDKGNIVALGEGRVRVNGTELAGETLRASRRLKIALFQPATNNYRVEQIGYTTAPQNVSIRVVSGGIKDMSLGYYSFMFSWANFDTAYGFSNPSDVVKFDAMSNPIQITGSRQRFELDFTNALLTKPSNADSVIIFRSQYKDSTDNITQAAEGSWFMAAQVKIADFVAGDIVYIDVLDGELDFEVTFDNDAPPDADWLAILNGDAVLVSCYGEKTLTNADGTSPGPAIAAQKRGNRDAFPADFAVSTSPPETIIGFVPGNERIYLMTRVSLPIAEPTLDSEQPVTTKPFWQTGFHSPFGLVLINEFLYAFTTKGVTRSIAIGDPGSEQFNFAAGVADITRGWNAGYVHAVHDKQNEMVVFIHSAAERNTNGYWKSLALPLYLNLQAFGPLIEITNPSRDMIVCGAANIGGKLQFLAGGRMPTIPLNFVVTGDTADWDDLVAAASYQLRIRLP